MPAKKGEKKKADSSPEEKGEITLPDINPRHRLFVLEYLNDWNATRAYKAVYPKASDDSARTNAARLLANDNIREILAHEADLVLDGKRDRLKTLVAESLDQDLSAEMKDYINRGTLDPKKLAEHNPRAISSITFENKKTSFGSQKKITLKLNDRSKAREHAMKLLGLLNDDSGKIIIVNPPPGLDEV